MCIWCYELSIPNETIAEALYGELYGEQSRNQGKTRQILFETRQNYSSDVTAPLKTFAARKRENGETTSGQPNKSEPFLYNKCFVVNKNRKLIFILGINVSIAKH